MSETAKHIKLSEKDADEIITFCRMIDNDAYVGRYKRKKARRIIAFFEDKKRESLTSSTT